MEIPRDAPLKRPSVINATFVPKPRPWIAEVGASISGIPMRAVRPPGVPGALLPAAVASAGNPAPPPHHAPRVICLLRMSAGRCQLRLSDLGLRFRICEFAERGDMQRGGWVGGHGRECKPRPLPQNTPWTGTNPKSAIQNISVMHMPCTHT